MVKATSTPSNKTKIQTTYGIVIKFYKYQDSVSYATNFEFQVDISILAIERDELATLQKRIKAFTKNPTPTVFETYSSNFTQTPTTKLQRA